MLKYLILTILLISIALPVFGYEMTVDLPNFDEEDNATLDTFLPAMFTLLISIAGIAALVVIMIGGYQYMTAGGSETRTGDAKNRIKNAILGLILALCSYLILNTINPNLAKPSLPGMTDIEPATGHWEDFDGGQDPKTICPPGPGHSACPESCSNCENEEYAKANKDECDNCKKVCCIFNPSSEECRSCIDSGCKDFCKSLEPPQERLEIVFDPNLCVCAKNCKDDPNVCGDSPCIDNKCVSENYCLQECTKGGLQTCTKKICNKIDNCLWFDDECIVSTPATICKSEDGIPKSETDNCEKVCQDSAKAFAKTLRDDPNCCLCREEQKEEGKEWPTEVMVYGKKWRWGDMTDQQEEWKKSPQYRGSGEKCEFLLGLEWEGEPSDRCADSDIGLGPRPSGNHLCCSKEIK